MLFNVYYEIYKNRLYLLLYVCVYVCLYSKKKMETSLNFLPTGDK